MISSRRSFLAAVASALAYDPERALWVPGAKTISVPALRAARSFIDACAAQQEAIDAETGIVMRLRHLPRWARYEVRWEFDAFLVPNGPSAAGVIRVGRLA